MTSERPSTERYYGEVFDEGRRLLIIQGVAGYARIVTIKMQTDQFSAEFVMAAEQARELARHLAEAAASADA